MQRQVIGDDAITLGQHLVDEATTTEGVLCQQCSVRWRVYRDAEAVGVGNLDVQILQVWKSTKVVVS